MSNEEKSPTLIYTMLIVLPLWRDFVEDWDEKFKLEDQGGDSAIYISSSITMMTADKAFHHWDWNLSIAPAIYDLRLKNVGTRIEYSCHCRNQPSDTFPCVGGVAGLACLLKIADDVRRQQQIKKQADTLFQRFLDKQ